MAGFNDFSALKGLKKELEKAESPQKESRPEKPAQARRDRTMVRKSREEHAGEQKAKELGLVSGSVVTLMDSNDRGILRHVRKDHVEIELEGMLIDVPFGGFIVNDPAEDRELMRRSGRAKPVKEKPKAAASVPSEITVDLHIEKIPGGYDAPEGFELPFQMEYFRRIVRQNLKHRGMRINVVHGVGDGILKDEVRREIEEVFALTCSWSPGPAGVTVVTVR